MKKGFWMSVFGISISLLFFSLFSILMIIGIRFLQPEENITPSKKDYQMYRLNIKTKEGSSGIVSFHKDLEENEYLSYEENDSLILISNFGLKEYECYGSCQCEEDDISRRVSHAISKGIIYLLAAATSSAALILARNHFKEECHKTLEEVCPSASIRSRVKECRPIRKVKTNRPKPRQQVEEKNEEVEEKNEYNRDIVSFECRGHCLQKTGFKSYLTQEASQDFDCKGIKQVGMITLDFKKKTSDKMKNYRARREFISTFLKGFCEMKSVDSNMISYRGGRYPRAMSLCMGHLHMKNDSVKCKQIYHTPD